MQIIKPLRLGIMTKAIADRPRGRLVMSGLVCFDLLHPETLLTEQAMWDSITPLLGEQGTLDAWTPKIHGEVLLWGTAAAPGGQPVTQMQVSLAVGEQIRKILQIRGDRHWQQTLMGESATDPTPFVSMPLTYERAFGGEGFTSNPVGAGHDALRRIRNGESVALPNIEHPSNPLLHPKQVPQPATLMPVCLSWPGYGPGGTYDDAWRKHRFPAVPLDYNWQAYNVAPLDQRIPSYFHGAESLELRGMHPDHEHIRSHLPGLRMRYFTLRKNRTQLEEATAVLDSICLFPSALRGVLVYRSELELPKGDDLQHIEAIMVACERAGEPRSDEYYEDIFRLRTGKDKALYALSDYQLMPPFSNADQLRLDARREEVRQEKADLSGKKEAWFAAFAAASVGFSLPDKFFHHDKTNDLPAMPVITDLDRELGNVDLASIRNTAHAIRDQLTAQADLMFKDADIKIAEVTRQGEILNQARLTGDMSPMLALADKSADPPDPTLSDTACTLNGIADRLEAEPDWSLSQATKSLTKSFQNDALAKAKEYEALLTPEDKERLAQASDALAQDAEKSTTPDSPESPESRTQFVATLRQIATGLAGKATPETQTAADLAGNQSDLFLHSMGLIGTASQAAPDVSSHIKMLGETLRDAQPEQGAEALIAALTSLPGTSAMDWAPMKVSLEQALQSQPDLLQKIGQGLAQPPDPQTIRAQLAAQFDFKSNRDAILSIPDEAQQASALAQLERSENDMLKSLGALAPDAVQDGKLDWEIFLSQMGIGDTPALPTIAPDMTAPEPPELQALQRARSLALGLPGVFRFGPELPPETPEEVKGRQQQEELFQNEDPVLNSHNNAMISEYLQASEDATQQHGELNAQARQDISDRMISHAQKQLATDPVKDNARMDKMVALTATAATMGHSIWRETAPGIEQLSRSGRQTSLVPMMASSDITPAIAQAVGAVVRQQAANGISLARRDLAGADLRGAQLLGVDLTGAFLEHADLSGADLSGAQCEGAVFTGACLTGAKLRGAQLKNTNFGQAQATHADFSGAQMDDANLYQANFNGADLRNVQLGKCNALQASFVQARFDHSRCDAGNFIKTDLSRATLSSANWHKAIFIKAKLNDSLARHANLRKCVFAEVEANDCDFSGADLRGVIAVKSSFKNLNAVDAQAEGSGWAQSDLSGAHFSRAGLKQAGFMAARLDGADLSYTNLHRAVLVNASLRGSSFEGAQLFEASFRGADLSHANLRHANLHRADLANTTLDGCDITGARRLQTTLEMPSAVPCD
jgi:uncharacterized protein YjbI with pentapeptide repeats